MRQNHCCHGRVRPYAMCKLIDADIYKNITEGMPQKYAMAAKTTYRGSAANGSRRKSDALGMNNSSGKSIATTDSGRFTFNTIDLDRNTDAEMAKTYPTNASSPTKKVIHSGRTADRKRFVRAVLSSCALSGMMSHDRVGRSMIHEKKKGAKTDSILKDEKRYEEAILVLAEMFTWSLGSESTSS